MRSQFASVRVLVLPAGAITGARIVLNGITGTIQIFNSADELVGEWDPDDFTVYEGSSGDFVRIVPNFMTSDGFVLPAVMWNEMVIFRSVGGGVLSITNATTDLGDLTIEGPPGIYQSVARGRVREQSLATNSAGFAADADTDMQLLNVPVVAGRFYAIHFHSQCTLSAAGQWRVECKVNGVVIGAFDLAVELLEILDGTVYWRPAATGSTDDIVVAVNELTGTATRTLQAAGDIPRTLVLEDRGI